MKVCSRCKRELSEDNFRVKDGRLYYVCKECERALRKEYYEKHKQHEFETHKIYMKTYSKTHRDKLNERSRNYKRKKLGIRPENYRGANALHHGEHNFTKADIIKMSRYGLTPEAFLALPNYCEACGSTENLCIDHDHITGRVRGTLCFRCNAALGMLSEDTNKMEGLINYINRFKDEAI